FSDTAPSVSLIKNGQVRALGVSTATRLAVLPDVAPLNDVGVPGFDAAGWFLIAGPGGTPKPIVDRLHAELKTVMAMAEVQEQIGRTGVVPVVSPPLADLTKFVATEKERWGKVVTQAGLAGTQ